MPVNPDYPHVRPDDVVTAANADADLVSPGIRWCLDHGLQMRIVAPRDIALNEAYRVATEQYSNTPVRPAWRIARTSWSC